MSDIPPRHDRFIWDETSFPINERSTSQWLLPEVMTNPFDRIYFPNNNDTTFGKGEARTKPPDVLLHYTYGLAAVKRWGRNIMLLEGDRSAVERSKDQEEVSSSSSLDKVS